MKRKPKYPRQAPRPLDVCWQVAMKKLEERYNDCERVRQVYTLEQLKTLLRESKLDEAQFVTAPDEQIQTSVSCWFAFGPQFCVAIAPIVYAREHLGYDPRYQNPDTTPRRD